MSLGGPVALEAARLLPEKAVAVIGVDTFQDLTVKQDPAVFQKRAQAFRRDFAGSCKVMTRQLFHPDADSALVTEVEHRLAKSSPDVIVAVMEGLTSYDMGKAVAGAKVPIRCLNGDLFPTRVDANRKVVPDFAAVIMSHVGHYPMLERPKEFDQRLEEIVKELPK